MSESKQPYQRDTTRLGASQSRFTHSDTIELEEIPTDPQMLIHPAFRNHNRSHPVSQSSTLVSDPDSCNPRSSGETSSWSQRRLLNWLKIQRRIETPSYTSAPFSGTRELGADEYHLAITGYDQVFSRYFTQWDNLFAMLATMGLATSLPAIVFLVIVYAGGPGAGLMNWIVMGLFSVVLTLCLGEIAASMPTSAGLYFYTYRLGGDQRGPFLSWVTAWLSWIGWLTVVPSSAQLSSNFLVSVFRIHWGGQAWVENPWFNWIIVILTLTVFVLVPNIMSPRTILWSLRICIATSTLLILMYLTWFPIKAGKDFNSKNLNESLNHVNHENVVYAPDAYAWALAALFPAWIFKGFEVSIHMSEETKRASRSVAFGMWAGVSTGYIIGIPVLIVLLSCVKDVHMLGNMGNLYPQGFAIYLLQLIGHYQTIFVLVLTWLDAALVTAVLFMSAQRLTFALARDDVLPYKSWITSVSAQKLPVNAAYVVFGYSFFVSMVGVIGTSTFQALLAIAVVSQNLSAALVIFARLTYGRRRFTPANWNLGKASIPLNMISLIYTLYLFLILILPFWFPVREHDFNFAPIAVTVIMFIAMLTWFSPRFGQSERWDGPQARERDNIVYAGTPPDRSPILKAQRIRPVTSQ